MPARSLSIRVPGPHTQYFRQRRALFVRNRTVLHRSVHERRRNTITTVSDRFQQGPNIGTPYATFYHLLLLFWGPLASADESQLLDATV